MLVSLAGLECTNLISTYPEDDPEEINKNMKSKMMLGVGAINVFVGVLLAIGNGLSRLHINFVYGNHNHVIYFLDRLGI